jgi:hypothetical protein
MKVCQVCKKERCDKLIDFGKHPICHKFTNGKEEEEKYPLTLGQCQFCGVVQLTSPIPIDKLVPRYDWITYNEPEEHLDHLVDVIANLPGITKESIICGVSYKEDTTLTRLNRIGFKDTWRIDMNEDLGIGNSKANLESIQHHIRPNIVNSIHQKYGVPDLIIVRHILEHTHDTLGFMSALKKLVNPSGYIIFEVPDCTKGFEKLDYTTIWEEHTLYFTDATFKICLNTGGFSLHYFEKYNYPFESVLIGIVKPNNIESALKPFLMDEYALTSEIKRVQLFTKQLTQKQNNIRKFLENFKQRQNDIVMFGTGHAACMFINLLGIKDLINFAIDDNHKKKGFYMPGSKLPIYNSESLVNKKTNLCLLGLSSESEKKIINKHRPFEENGGVFASIYPTSKYAIQV